MPEPNRHMFRTVTEMRRQLVRHGKTTALMVTQACRFDLFAQSLLSLFLRTDPDYLDCVIVIVNGGRPGSRELQDRKEAFLTDLTLVEWHGGLFPLAILSLYGVGGGLTHSACLDSAMSFVTTEFFLSVHDDVIVRTPDWVSHANRAFEDPAVAMAACPHLLMCRCQQTAPPGDLSRRVLLVPHPNTCFLTCRSEPFFELDCRWLGYCADLPQVMRLSEMEPEVVKMCEFYDKHVQFPGMPGVEDHVLNEEKPFVVVGHDVGAKYLNTLWVNGYKGVALKDDLVAHILSATWHRPADVDARLKNEFRADVESVDAAIRADAALGPVYAEHMLRNGY